MDWYIASVLGASLFAVISVFDKRLLAHHFPSVLALYVAFAMIHLPRAAVLFALAMLGTGLTGWSGLPWAIASGLFWALGIGLFFYGLAIEELTRAAPMQSITPVFTVAIAVWLFGEPMTTTNWLGAFWIIAGAIAINLRIVAGRPSLPQKRAFLVLLLSAFVIAWGSDSSPFIRRTVSLLTN